MFTRPRLRMKDIYEATVYSAVISSVAGMLLGVGAIVAWILTYNQVTQAVADMLVAFTSNPIVFMMIVMGALLFLGMLMDAVPIMICLAPLLAPVAKQYGINEVQFGLIFVITCMIGLVTPPVGIVLFMTTGISGVKLEPLSKAVLPFVIWMILVVVLMVYFPWLTLWLPKVLGF